MYEDEISLLTEAKDVCDQEICAAIDRVILTLRAAAPRDEGAERAECAAEIERLMAELRDARAEIADRDRWVAECTDRHRMTREIHEAHVAALRAECAAEIERLTRRVQNQDSQILQNNALILGLQTKLGDTRAEIERLKAQLSGVGMQEFRRLEGRLHNAQAEIKRLKAEVGDRAIKCPTCNHYKNAHPDWCHTEVK
jgi:chromosome segregation ATPase